MIDDHYVYINSLVNKIKEEDNEALHELFFFYRPLILSAIRRCCNKEKSLYSHRDDLNNESIFVLKNLVEKYDSDLSYFSYYLSTRIDHALLAHFKVTFLSKIETRDYSEVYHNYDPFDRIMNEIVIGEALEKLNEKQKEAITLYFFEELSQEEAALKAGITQASFSKRLDRALKTLKGIIEDPL
jgi:RNA polymerase sigma factor (sigma-70 family)